MLRYVDGDGEVKLKISGLEKPGAIRERRKGPTISLLEVEEDIRRMLMKETPKVFFCLEVKDVIIVITAWEIISLWYYLGIIALRWVNDCEDVYNFTFDYPHLSGVIASVILHPVGWLLLCYLPDKKVSVVICGLVAHFLVTILFVLGSIGSYLSSAYISLGVYVILSAAYLYIVILYNTLMHELSHGKYDIFNDIACCLNRFFDYIGSKL
nr:uncharacterized protein LOC106692029 [Halyomorpha halys]